MITVYYMFKNGTEFATTGLYEIFAAYLVESDLIFMKSVTNKVRSNKHVFIDYNVST